VVLDASDPAHLVRRGYDVADHQESGLAHAVAVGGLAGRGLVGLNGSRVWQGGEAEGAASDLNKTACWADQMRTHRNGFPPSLSPSLPLSLPASLTSASRRRAAPITASSPAPSNPSTRLSSSSSADGLGGGGMDGRKEGTPPH
jgi:hypothetical protein